MTMKITINELKQIIREEAEEVHKSLLTKKGKLKYVGNLAVYTSGADIYASGHSSTWEYVEEVHPKAARYEDKSEPFDDLEQAKEWTLNKYNEATSNVDSVDFDAWVDVLGPSGGKRGKYEYDIYSKKFDYFPKMR